MRSVGQASGIRCLGILILLLTETLSLRADPIVDIHEEALFQPRTIFNLTAAILVEAGCIFLLMRRWRTPRLFILWILGMHLFTYPLFLALVWVGRFMQPLVSVAAGEGAIVVIEGSLVYLMCRFAPSGKTQQSAPSLFKSIFVSLLGNACSAIAFPLLIRFNPS